MGLSARTICSVQSSCSTLTNSSCSKSIASVSTLFYDAKLPPQDLQTVDVSLKKGDIKRDKKRATGLRLCEAGDDIFDV